MNHSRFKKSNIRLYKTNDYDLIFIYIILSLYFFHFIFITRFPINVAPIFIGIPFYFITLLTTKISINRKFIASWFFLLFFSSLALTYLALEKGAKSIISLEFYFFISLPLMYLAIIRLKSKGKENHLSKVFLVFLCWQLFVILGELSMNITGFGFNNPASYSNNLEKHYSFMLSGTYINSNNLAAVSGMILVFYIINNKNNKHTNLAIFLCFTIALLTVSRSVLVFMALTLTVYYFNKKRLLGFLSIALTFLLLYILMYFSQKYLSNFEVIMRVVNKVETLMIIYNNGLDTDGSVSSRFISYLHFINNLKILGLGTGKFQNYEFFVNSLGPHFKLMALNPHSFVVEIGYWLGWLGLILFFSFILTVKFKSILASAYVLFSFIYLSLV